jgi:uncharacterized protein involved in exopolysaccharide biosynthesis
VTNNDDLDIVVRAVVRYWRLIGIGTIAAALLGYGLAVWLPKTYAADVVLAAAESPQSTSGLQALTGQGLGGLLSSLTGESRVAATVLATLTSRQFLYHFIEEENLLPALFESDWDDNAHRWRGSPRTVEDGYAILRRRVLTVSEDANGLITLHVEWRDPRLAARWANQLVQRLNAALRDKAIADTETNLMYLDRELMTADTIELRRTIYSLIESQQSRRMLANTHPDFALRVIDAAQPPQIDGYVWPIPRLFAAVAASAVALVSLALAVMRVAFFTRKMPSVTA